MFLSVEYQYVGMRVVGRCLRAQWGEVAAVAGVRSGWSAKGRSPHTRPCIAPEWLQCPHRANTHTQLFLTHRCSRTAALLH